MLQQAGPGMSKLAMERYPQSVLIPAYEWIALQAEGRLSAEQQAEFDAWMESDPQHAAAFQCARAMWGELGELGPEDLPKELLRPSWSERLRARLGRGRARERRPAPIPAALWAAGLTAAAVAILLLPPSESVEEQARPLVFSTARSELADVLLPDGTRATLGGDSSLRVVIGSQTRRILLERGEAYFDVAKDPDRPFVVRAGAVRARALGTAFEVRRRGDRTTVAVAEGLVSVAHAPVDRAGISSAVGGAAASIELGIGERVAASDAKGLGSSSLVRYEAIGAWRSGRLVYVRSPLSDVVADANRYHELPVVLGDPRLAEFEVTGSFRSHDIEAMLAALSELFPIGVQRSPQEVRLVPRL